MGNRFEVWLILIFGAAILGSALADAEFLYSGSKGRMWLRLFGRRGSRVAFLLIGAGTLLLGVLGLLGVVDLRK